MIDVLFLAFKDALYQRKLLLVVFLALTVGICNTAITTGVMNGFERYMTEELVEVMSAHVLILASGGDYIKNVESIIEKAENMREVKTVLVRSHFIANVRFVGKETSLMMRNLPIEVIAVDAEKESKELALADMMKEGIFLEGEPGETIVGDYMADFLNLEVGDTVTLDFRNGVKKNFKIKGILDTGIEDFDTNFFINLEDGSEVFGGKGRYNYIAIKTYDKKKADVVKAALLSEGVQENIMTWDEAMVFLKNILDTFSLVLFVVSGIAIITAALSVAVLMYINVLNKTREIGTLKAMGASDRKIVAFVLTEAAIIATMGVIVGNVIALIIVAYMSQNPIVLPEATIRFSVDYSAMLISSIVAILAVIISASYPAYVASKLEVVEAMRYE